MQHPSRTAWALFCVLCAACSAVTEFDRDKLPSNASERDVDAGADDDMDASRSSHRDARVTTPEDGGMEVPHSDASVIAVVSPDGAIVGGDSGPSSACKAHADCARNQLCCGNACVAATENRCSDCEAACTATAANACNDRVCGCGTGPACSAAKPYCSGSGAASSCVQCRDATDCAGRTDGRTQCIKGTCAACEPSNNAGCSGTTPICNATTLTCEACKVSPDNCPGTPVCTPSGACGGCTTNDAADCINPTAPICNLAVNPSMCRGCASDAECMAERAQPYCISAQRCGACNPTNDLGCAANSATPDCRLNPAGQYQCQACTASSCASGARCDSASGKCVECRDASDCTSPVRPFCDTAVGLCKPCGDSAGVAALDDAWCALNTPLLSSRPVCDPSGRCVICNEARNGCFGNATRCLVNAANPQNNRCVECRSSAECPAERPSCNTSNYTCRGCQQDSECVNGNARICDPSRGCVRCRVGQRGAAAGCGGNEVCALGTNNAPECVGCTGNGDCRGNTPVCDTNRRVCVPCLAAGDCNRQQCLTGPDTSQNRCVQCINAGQCTGANPCQVAACTGNSCVYSPRPLVDDGFTCTVETCDQTGPRSVPDNTRCPGTLCRPGTCVGTGGELGTGCRFTDVSCGGGAVCDPLTGVCSMPAPSP